MLSLRALVSLASIATLTTSALASFDLLLAADNAEDCIHRYDAENRVYLGQINIAAGNVYDIAADSSSSTVYALVDSPGGVGIQRYNYNTGAFLGSFSIQGLDATGARALSMGANGELIVSFERKVFRVNGTTGAQIGATLKRNDNKFLFSSGGAAYHATSSNYYLAGDSDGTTWNNDFVMGFNSASVQQNSWQEPNFAENDITFRDIVISGSTMIVSGQRLSFNNSFHYVVNLDSGGNPSNRFSVAELNQYNGGAEFGHEGQAYLFTTNSVGELPRIRSYDSTLGLSGPKWDLSQNTSLNGTAMIIAPEPGTLLALGAGFGLLARRRKFGQKKG